VRYGGAKTFSAIYGNSISDANLFRLVSSSITSGALPMDTNGVYFVLTSAEVTASSGFCSDYCGALGGGGGVLTIYSDSPP
jgi:hypothetical protein